MSALKKEAFHRLRSVGERKYIDHIVAGEGRGAVEANKVHRG